MLCLSRLRKREQRFWLIEHVEGPNFWSDRLENYKILTYRRQQWASICSRSSKQRKTITKMMIMIACEAVCLALHQVPAAIHLALLHHRRQQIQHFKDRLRLTLDFGFELILWCITKTRLLNWQLDEWFSNSFFP